MHPTECQDTVLAVPRQGYLLLAAADGVASCQYPKMASSRAVAAIEAEFATELHPPDQASEFLEWIRSTASAAEQRFMDACKGRIDLFSTTLAAAVVTPAYVGIASVGDGFVLIGSDQLGVVVAVPPQRPDGGKSGATWVFGEQPSQLQFRAMSVEGINSVTLSTDGLERLLRFCAVSSGSETHQRVAGPAPALTQLVTQIESGHGQAALDAFETSALRTLKNDDVGLVVAYRG